MSVEIVNQKLEELEVNELEKLGESRRKNYKENIKNLYFLIEKFQLNPIRYIPLLVVLPKIESIYNIGYLKTYPFTNYFNKLVNPKKEINRSSLVKTNLVKFIPGYMLIDYLLLKLAYNSKDHKNYSLGYFLAWHGFASVLFPYCTLTLLSKLTAMTFVTKEINIGHQRFIGFNVLAYILLAKQIWKLSYKSCDYLFDYKELEQTKKIEQVEVLNQNEKTEVKPIPDILTPIVEEKKIEEVVSPIIDAKYAKTYYKLKIDLSNDKKVEGISWVADNDNLNSKNDQFDAEFNGLNSQNHEFINISIKDGFMIVKGLKLEGKKH